MFRTMFRRDGQSFFAAGRSPDALDSGALQSLFHKVSHSGIAVHDQNSVRTLLIAH